MNNKTEPPKTDRTPGHQNVKKSPITRWVAKRPPKQRSKGDDKR